MAIFQMARQRSSDSGFTERQKLILSGLYLSKFDSDGLRSLGFDTFTEAFNAIGYALGSQPASVKNYRDEFDPLFPNQRKGWRNRPIRGYCREIYDLYKRLGLDDFTGLIRSFFSLGDDVLTEATHAEQQDEGSSAFAQRLVTGLAAERYFESICGSLPTFQGLALENTTALGCGYDFRLRPVSEGAEFLAVEVKGLMGRSGGVALTQKEYDAAARIKERFFLFVVSNFRETPTHAIYRDPLCGGLNFRRTERVIVQVSWLTSV
ncbi:MAG TPA: DUF3883 domain-containing protein [Terracidiphilus sp.]|nr:DUF3883 domain-containing protein [Terracidiphilus sp.]